MFVRAAISSSDTVGTCRKWESREGGVHQGEIQIALGAWEDTQGDQDGNNTKEAVNYGMPKLQYWQQGCL